MKKIWHTLVCGAAILTVTVATHATVVKFNGFESTAGLKLNGNAKSTAATDPATGQPVLRLTEARGGQSGSFFSAKTISAATFSTYFQFRITAPGGSPFDCNTKNGADGIVFVVQAISSSLGSSGAGIGYAGIGKSVGIEIDTWCNGGNNDPSSNHIGIVTNGNVNHGQGSPFTKTISPDFDDGNVWHVWVDYNGQDMEARISQTPVRPREATISRPIDLPKLLGGDGTPVEQAFVGFTSATGADWANHDILVWEYRDSYAPVTAPLSKALPTPLPERKPGAAWRGGFWKEYDYGGCDGFDIRRTDFPVPDDDFCNSAAVGTVVVCDADRGGCYYKSVTAKQCKGGKLQSRMYVCTPK